MNGNFPFASFCLHIVQLAVVYALDDLNAIRRSSLPPDGEDLADTHGSENNECGNRLGVALVLNYLQLQWLRIGRPPISHHKPT
jgi:hypothetical protein